MKKIGIIIIVLCLGFGVRAQGQYEQGMKKAFGLWKEQKNTEAASLFERIGVAEKNNWLPYYYASQIYAFQAFGKKSKPEVNMLTEKAQAYLDKAMEISPNNPEIMVQQALIHTAWIAFDGATYGMTLSGKVVSLYERAKAIAPNNPRVILSLAEWNMGGAKFFGIDPKKYCPDIEKALELFSTFKPETSFHPSWGKERAESLLKNCGA
ncbi:MAG: hypothetical protein OIF50_04135 [Flavobacteriaceae bacterium]|nr:hypothetical protein [Flavobacteriaceae bacterium]